MLLSISIVGCAAQPYIEKPLKDPHFEVKNIDQGLHQLTLIDTQNEIPTALANNAWKEKAAEICQGAVRDINLHLEYSKPPSQIESLLTYGFNTLHGINTRDISVIDGVFTCASSPLSEEEISSVLIQKKYINP